MVSQSDNYWGRVETLGVCTQCFIHSEEQNKAKKKKEKYKNIDEGMGLRPMYKKINKSIKIMVFLDEAEKQEFLH